MSNNLVKRVRAPRARTAVAKAVTRLADYIAP